ncbi:Transcriptional activator protein AnoR [Ephemeroptericola cinctiostellae]|uniref:Transcriptional activator protein AnoR n=1 Tax=Ephemeroptericola cinctiostellae TaxID=2268024 RepID=A0A345DEB7_9BURK|nr:LuxR family transcriptional regulator [Ephemeroptericola cinctiostellae]AXF86705.1 Transcriptional activator protein AnoR [Ephemeroptericola cinctiostellae]
MSNRLELGAFSFAKDEHELLVLLASATQELGFDHYSYGVRLPLPKSQPKTLIFSNYSKRWYQRYVRENYVGIDPTVQHGLRSVLPLQWSSQTAQECPEFWEEAAAHGLCTGWAQSCFGPSGMIGMLTFSHSNATVPSQAQERDMRVLNQVMHERMTHVLTVQNIMDEVILLNPRELEVLRWAADGKTSAEAGDILNLSERTVNFYMGHVLDKLGVTNKTAAVVKAIALNLI